MNIVYFGQQSSPSGLHSKVSEKMVLCPKRTHNLKRPGEAISKQPLEKMLHWMNRDSCSSLINIGKATTWKRAFLTNKLRV